MHYCYGYRETLYRPIGAGGGGSGSLYWLDPVANFASLPLTDPVGAARYVVDTGIVYTYDGIAWSPVGASSGDIVYSGTAPIAGLFNGKLWMDTGNNYLYSYDSTRGKWLGLDEFTASGARASNAVTNLFARAFDGTPMNLVTVEVPYDYTLIRLQATSRIGVNQTWVAEVRINGSLVPSAVLNVTAADSAQDDTLDLDVNAGDKIQLYINGNVIQYPRIDAFFKRRG
jgi:hypothetical protein